MCHIALSKLRSLILFSALFLLSLLLLSYPPYLPLLLPLLHSDLYLFTLVLVHFLPYQPHFAPFLTSTLCRVFFKCFIFTHILSPSIPVTLCYSRQNYYSWREHWLSGAVLCSLCIIHLWSIPFCGEPSSYSPVMIGVLATPCIYTVI